MSKSPPRASLSITILDDEDFHVLLTLPGGFEAFGQFCSLLIVGRERFQQGKAARVGETEALVFTNKLTHVLGRARMVRSQLDALLLILRAVADEADSEPWLTLEDERLSIRSFFKYHAPTDSGWGGARNGSGRKTKNQDDSVPGNQDDSLSGIKMIPIKNQDDSEKNQDDSQGNQDEKNQNHLEKNKESSCSLSVSDSIAIANPDRQIRASAGPSGCLSVDHGSHQECVEEAADLFADVPHVAQAVSRSQADLTEWLKDAEGRTRWDAFAAALRTVNRIRSRPGATPTRDVISAAKKFAGEWIATGEIPPEPVEAPAVEPRYRRRATSDDTVLPPPVRATEAELARYNPPLPAPRSDPEARPQFRTMEEFAAEFNRRNNVRTASKGDA